MINKIKKHSKDIEDDLTQAVIDFFQKTEEKVPSSVSIKVKANALQDAVIHIDIKD